MFNVRKRQSDWSGLVKSKMASASKQFALDDCKAALKDILEAFKYPENMVRMEEARDNAGNDMLKNMQIVFPVATQIETDVIEKYGFPRDGDGIIRFTQAVKMYEKQDADVAMLNGQLRTILMPPLAMQTPPTLNSSHPQTTAS